MWKLGPGAKVLLVLMGLAILAFTTDSYLLGGKMRTRLGLSGEEAAPSNALKLTAADFPAGVAAPIGDFVTIPPRPLKLGLLPRGSNAAPLYAAGGLGFRKEARSSRTFGLDLDVALHADEASLVAALKEGGDRGGIDAAILSVDRLAQLREELPDLRLKAVMLVSRSRGHDALAAAGFDQPAALRGKRIAVPQRSPARFLLMWTLSQALLSPDDVTLVQAANSVEAARFFRESRVDAAVGAAADLLGPARERAGRVIASTADAPHLVATVVVVRGSFLARYPDAVRRMVRALLDAGEPMSREETNAARLLATHVPTLGDPFEAVRADPPATFSDNMAFFGIKGDVPVRFHELYASAAALWHKLGEPADSGPPADAVELGPLLLASTNPPVYTPPPPPPAAPAVGPTPPAAPAVGPAAPTGATPAAPKPGVKAEAEAPATPAAPPK